MGRLPHRVRSAALAAFWLLAAAAPGRAQSVANGDAALAARGEYLARAADCLPCHTGDKSKPFAGGLPLHTPFGTIFSVNITSDPETGIGRPLLRRVAEKFVDLWADIAKAPTEA